MATLKNKVKYAEWISMVEECNYSYQSEVPQ